MADGSAQLRDLAVRLKAAGTEGRGLRKELASGLEEAAKPLGEKITSAEHLAPYLPNRYAEVLAADLGWQVTSSFGSDPRVQLRVQPREQRRKVRMLNNGLINHPIYPRGPRKRWHWQSRQTGGMRPGFFDDACRDAIPDIRSRVMQALAEIAAKITHA